MTTVTKTFFATGCVNAGVTAFPDEYICNIGGGGWVACRSRGLGLSKAIPLRHLNEMPMRKFALRSTKSHSENRIKARR